MKARSVFALVFIFVSISSMAQTQLKKRPACVAITTPAKPIISDDGKEVVEPYDGTYRFFFTKGVKQVFSDEIFKTIELNRKDDEEVTVTLSAYCKVRILSKKQIHQIGFVPFSKSYIFEKPDSNK